MKGGCQTLKSLLAGNRQDKTTQQPAYIALHEKGRITQMVKPITQGGTAYSGRNSATHLPSTFLYSSPPWLFPLGLPLTNLLPCPSQGPFLSSHQLSL